MSDTTPDRTIRLANKQKRDLHEAIQMLQMFNQDKKSTGQREQGFQVDLTQKEYDDSINVLTRIAGRVKEWSGTEYQWSDTEKMPISMLMLSTVTLRRILEADVGDGWREAVEVVTAWAISQ